MPPQPILQVWNFSFTETAHLLYLPSTKTRFPQSKVFHGLGGASPEQPATAPMRIKRPGSEAVEKGVQVVSRLYAPTVLTNNIDPDG